MKTTKYSLWHSTHIETTVLWFYVALGFCRIIKTTAALLAINNDKHQVLIEGHSKI